MSHNEETLNKEDMQRVLGRLQKLLANANDSRANPNEAAAAAQMAERIMRKYQVDHAAAMSVDVRTRRDALSVKACSVIMKRDVTGKGAHIPQKIPAWGGWLACSVAKLNDCEIRYATEPGRGAVVRFYGYDADVQVAAWTFDYLVGIVISALRRFQKEARREKAESESYRRGFVLAVCGLLNKECAAKRAEMQAAVASRALVLVKSTAIVEQFGEFKYGKASATTVSSTSAYVLGREAGSKVNVSARGLGHDAPTTHRRLS